MFIGLMVNVHAIKLPMHIVLGAKPLILTIYSNIIIWFFDAPGFKVIKYHKITLVGVPSSSVSVGLGFIFSYYVECYKDRGFVVL